MRIFLLTMDSSCFAAQEADDYPEVRELKDWQENGWVDLIKSGVLEKESHDYKGNLETLKRKTNELSLDHGINLFGYPGGNPNEEHELPEHSWPFGPGTSKFVEIYKVLFGETWQEGKKAKSKIRDALHLDTHQINERDYFLTLDSHFFEKASELECYFGILVRKPKECVAQIEEYWKRDSKFPPEILTSPKIIAGTCTFNQFRIPRFEVLKSPSNFFTLKGSLYSQSAEELIEFSEEIAIKHPKASVHANPSEISNRNRIVIKKQTYASVVADYDKNKVFEARVLAKGHLLLWGQFFNERGQEVAYSDKQELRLFGPISL